MSTAHALGGAPHKSLDVRLRAVEREVIDLWWELGPAGPTAGSTEAGEPDTARARYLLPLVRALQGALRGSEDHLAVYLDERLRYVHGSGGADQRLALGNVLEQELPALARLIAGSTDPVEIENALRDLHRPLIEPDHDPTRLLFVGDCLFVETRAFLTPRARASGYGVDVRQVFFSANQNPAAIDTALTAEVERFGPHLIGLSLFTFEGIPPYAAAWRDAGLPGRGRRALAAVPGLVATAAKAIVDIRTVSDAPIVVHSPCGLPLDPLRRRLKGLPPHSRAQRRLLNRLAAGLSELVEATSNTVLLDERSRVASRELRAVAGPALNPADVPVGYSHATRLGGRLTTAYLDVVLAYRRLARAKVLFVDFDNTLWRGVMAEGPVVHDRSGQRLLKKLKEAGVLLVALSKNDPAAIRWDEMELGREDFVLHQVNWNPKPDNVAAAIQALDLGPDACLLLDDNPVERALVVEQVIGVQAFDPAEAATWQSLTYWLQFPSTKQTAEARQRTEMYRQAAERRTTLSGTHDYATMMRGLRLRCSVRPAVVADTERLLELIQRTNQFNTTTIRRSAAEVAALLRDPAYGVHVATLRDRFGDLGVVGVVVFDRASSGFESVIMSCRAMGFGLELAMIALTLQAERPTRAVEGRFVPTDRNGPAAGLFERAGFLPTTGGRWVAADVSAVADVPDWFTVERP